MKSKERLKEIDILRAVAFIFVVIQHTVGGFSNIKGISYYEYSTMKFLYVIAKTAVPIFLFISAISLFYVYTDKVDWKKYYVKRLKYVVIPYVIWSAINMYKLGNEERFKDFFIQIIAGNGAFHLWYMGMIIRVYLIFPIILYAAKKVHALNIKLRFGVFVGIIYIYFIVSKYQNVISDNLGTLIFRNPTAVQQRIINISILFWFLYFVLGIYVAMNYGYIKSKVLKYKYAIISIYFMLFVYAYLNEIEAVKFIRQFSLMYTVFSILTFYIFSLFLAKKVRFYSLIKYISDYSFVAYMAHIIVINKVANNLRFRFPSISYLFLGILTLIITAIATPLFFYGVSFIKYSGYLTGTKNLSRRFWKKKVSSEVNNPSSL